jgi:hypothetical protein
VAAGGARRSPTKPGEGLSVNGRAAGAALAQELQGRRTSENAVTAKFAFKAFYEVRMYRIFSTLVNQLLYLGGHC